MKHLGTFILLITCLTSWAAARQSATLVGAEISSPSLQPGGSAVATVTIQVSEGLHAQSHTPLDASFIPFTVTIPPEAGIAANAPEYPPAKEQTFPQLGKLSVYVGQVVVRIPLRVAADAAAGAIELKGKVRLQACNDASCFPPESIPFSIAVTVGGNNAATQPATTPVAVPTPSPTTIPANADPEVFGVNLARGGIPLALAAAFLVGIVFNAMPCVLPVMPLKIMGFYEASQHERGKSLRLGAVFSAGIVLFFLILATLIVGLHTFAWGDLFKQTWFTALIVGVLTAMALGTFGFFSINVPSSLYAFSPRHDTYTGNFLFGIFTAMLSTPCTFGAFVALLAWTLTQPATVGFALFACVGLGMAFPYFLLSAFPEVARRFPRAGPWSEVVKQMMAFMLLATAVFFAQPLISRWFSSVAVWWTIFAVISAAALFLIARSLQLSSRLLPRLIATAIAIVLILPSFALVRRLTSQPYRWQPFAPSVLNDALAAGRPVVIDFTADWCGNCHWLEATVLHDPKIVSAVRDKDVLMLQADVTFDNAPGQPLLEQLNPARSIPLTAVYIPAHDNKPTLLDGIYSTGDLLRLLRGG